MRLSGRLAIEVSLLDRDRKLGVISGSEGTSTSSGGEMRRPEEEGEEDEEEEEGKEEER